MGKQHFVFISALLGIKCVAIGLFSIDHRAQAASLPKIVMTAEEKLYHAKNGDHNSRSSELGAIDEVILLHPDYAKAYFERAEVRRECSPVTGCTNSLEETRLASLKDYTQAIQLNPSYVIAYSQRASLLVEIGNLQAAFSDYTKAIQLAPDDPNLYCQRGLMRDQLNDQGGATADYLQALRMAPIENVKRADNKLAIARFDQIVHQNPELAHIYYRGLARLYISNNWRDHPQEDIYRDLTQAIQLNPNFADAYYYRGLNYFTSLDSYSSDFSYKDAIDDFTQTIKLNPTSSNAYFERGLAYFLKSNDCKKQGTCNQDKVFAGKNENLNAIRDFSQAIRINPNHARAYYYRGRAYSGLNDSKAVIDYVRFLRTDSRSYAYDRSSIDDYILALQTSPKQANDYYQRGLIRRKLQDNLGAISDFTKAISLDSRFSKAYYARGVIHKSLKSPGTGAVDFDQAIRWNPNFAEAYFERNFPHLAVERIEKVRDPAIAMHLNPTFAQALYPLILTYDVNWQKSLGTITQVIRLNPDFAQAFCSSQSQGEVGWLCNPSDEIPEKYTQTPRLDFDEAYDSPFLVSELVMYEQEQARRVIKRSTQIIHTNSYSIDAYFKRGLAYLKLDELASAISNFTKVIQFNPQDSEAYINRGFAFYRLKHYSNAVSDYTKAIQMNPRFANTYLLRGLVHSDMGHYGQAVNDTTQAIQLDPALANAYIVRSYTRTALKDPEGAEQDFWFGLNLLPNFAQGLGGGILRAGSENAEPYYNRGVSFARRGDKQAAIRALQLAASLYRSQGNTTRYQETSAFIRQMQR